MAMPPSNVHYRFAEVRNHRVFYPDAGSRARHFRQSPRSCRRERRMLAVARRVVAARALCHHRRRVLGLNRVHGSASNGQSRATLPANVFEPMNRPIGLPGVILAMCS